MLPGRENKRVDEEVDKELVKDKDRCCYCCVPLCTGATPWYISFFVWPFVLLWNCIRVYFWPCIYVLCGTCLEIVCCCCCRNYCKSCYLYEDDEFERANSSLAVLEPEDGEPRFKSSILKELDAKKQIRMDGEKIDFEPEDEKFHRIEWRRTSELTENDSGKTYLFHDGLYLLFFLIVFVSVCECL